MSRRHRAVKREVIPDPKFKDVVVSKFMSCLMFDGKRSLAESIVYGAFGFGFFCYGVGGFIDEFFL